MQRPAKLTRVSKATREKIIKAASRAFALGGYDGASIRAIVAEADVNQAAINYHFGSKEGLYRAVLQVAVRALWLFGQCSIFVRNAEQLAKAPFRLEVDEDFVDRLADMIAGWAANGLGRLPSKARP